MLHTTRRLLTGPLLIAAIGAGLAVAPGAAQAADVAATVRVGNTLLVRSAPSLAATSVGRLTNGQKIAIQCTVKGTTVTGTMRTSNVWDRIGTGKYISFAYVGGATAVAKPCADSTPQAETVKTKPATTTPAVIVGTVSSTEGLVNVRSAAAKSAAKVGTLASGAKVNLVCGVVGDLVAGSVRTTTQWDRMTSGNYVSHAFIITPTLKLCPDVKSGTPVVTAPAVTLTPAQFIAAAVPGAQQGWREFGVPASVTLAQAILESGWGKSGLSAVDKNYFGIKCFNNVYGTIANGCHVYNTQECTKAGSCFATTAAFRTYSSMTNSIRDHGNFLKVNSRYKPSFTYTKDANKFIWNVWKAGYATDPNYYTKVTGIMAARNLYQYDTWK
jgi:hypothetical protein